MDKKTTMLVGVYNAHIFNMRMVESQGFVYEHILPLFFHIIGLLNDIFYIIS